MILQTQPTSNKSGFFKSPVFLGWIIPISLLDDIESFTICRYLGSKIFNGTVVSGKTMKFDKGKIAIFVGNLFDISIIEY